MNQVVVESLTVAVTNSVNGKVLFNERLDVLPVVVPSVVQVVVPASKERRKYIKYHPSIVQ